MKVEYNYKTVSQALDSAWGVFYESLADNLDNKSAMDICHQMNLKDVYNSVQSIAVNSVKIIEED